MQKVWLFEGKLLVILIVFGLATLGLGEVAICGHENLPANSTDTCSFEIQQNILENVNFTCSFSEKLLLLSWDNYTESVISFQFNVTTTGCPAQQNFCIHSKGNEASFPWTGLMESCHFIITTRNIIVQRTFLEDLTVTSAFSSNNEGTCFFQFNFTWSEVLDEKLQDVIISFKPDNDNCYELETKDNFILPGNKTFLWPEMEDSSSVKALNCNYLITFHYISGDYAVRQEIQHAVIPDNKSCKCFEAMSSYKIKQIELNNFEIEWSNKEEKEFKKLKCDYYQNDQVLTANPLQISLSLEDKIPRFSTENLLPNNDYTFECFLMYSIKGICFYSHETNTFHISHQKSNFLIFFVITLILLLLISILIVFKWQKCFKKFTDKVISHHEVVALRDFRNEMQANRQYEPFEPQDIKDEFEVPHHLLQLKELLDGGEYGKVYLAKAFNIGNVKEQIVAVKEAVGDSLTAKNEFLEEISIMKKLNDHPHIVKLIACCTKEPYRIVMELVPWGSLLKYLMRVRSEWDNKANPRFFFPENVHIPPYKGHQNILNYTQNQNWNDLQTPTFRMVPPKTLNGPWTPIPVIFSKTPLLNDTTSLSSSNFPVTPETARTNLEEDLISSSYILKSVKPELSNAELKRFGLQIADGMSYMEKLGITHRDLAARNILITTEKQLKISDFGLSRSGVYVVKDNKRLPLRWMALESILKGTFSCKSDVWSFGVVLWEIGTLGGIPYDNIEMSCLAPELIKGTRLERPEICTNDLYEIMRSCWLDKPEERPSFGDLCEVLKRSGYVDFNTVNPEYEFPPSMESKEK